MMDLTEQIRGLRDALLEGLVEREDAVRLALLAALAGEHLLLIGPPGTAKSLIARRLRSAFHGATYFERLLTRFSVPEELFGPLSIKALEDDQYLRKIDGYLPTASIVFLDEIFKANSAILNALLTLINERRFDNGPERIDTPLISAVGASNELPEGEELHALYDRFLLRLHLGPISPEGFPALLGLRGESAPTIPDELKLDVETLASLRTRAQRVEVDDDVLAMLAALRQHLNEQQIVVSDRRWRKILALLQMSALTNGRETVSIWDCWLLQHCTWSEPEQRQQIYDWYGLRVGAKQQLNPTNLTRIVTAWEAQLTHDQESRSQARDAKGQPLYLDVSGKTTAAAKGPRPAQRNGEPLYLAPQPSWTRPYQERQIKDRSNNNRGLTLEQLNSVYISHHGRFQDWDQQGVYLSDLNNRFMIEGDQPARMEPTKHKPAYIDQMVEQVHEIVSDIRDYQEQLDEHVASLEEDIRTHLWVSEGFIVPARAHLEETGRVVRGLLQRAERVKKGFSMLPREDLPEVLVERGVAPKGRRTRKKG